MLHQIKLFRIQNYTVNQIALIILSHPFQKKTIKSPLDVTSRMATPQVIVNNSSAFPETLFYRNGILYEVLEVDDINFQVKCRPVHDLDDTEVVLPANLVARQVESIGS